MGTEGSKNQVEHNDTIRQLPTIDPLRQQPPAEHSPPANTMEDPQDAQRKPKKQQEKGWPLPPDEFNSLFETNWFTDQERYSLRRAYAAKLSSSRLTMPTAMLNREHHQRETSTTQWNKGNSSIHDSAHVQSTLKTQSHSCYSLSTTEEIDTLMVKLNYAHMKLDDSVKRRLDIISKKTEVIIERIVVDTQDIQQRLLSFAKAQQMRQDELYREWLQMYVAILDEWKSLRLAKLQEKLCTYQKQIVIKSQRQISSVHLEANRIKTQILTEEQEKASQEINELIIQIESLTSHQTLEHLGSETMTKIDLTIQANVGKKAPGQHCTFDFGQNGSAGAPQSRASAQPVTRPSPKSNAGKLVNTEMTTGVTEKQYRISAIATVVPKEQEKHFPSYHEK